MNIHEHQAKDIFRQYGIPVQNGAVIMNKDQIDSTLDRFEAPLYVVKAQIHAGGRGKAGGVKLSKDKNEAKKIAHDMWGKVLVTPQTGPEGKAVQRIYVESGCNFVKELYISIVLDRSNKCISFIASSEGGVEIEEVSETHPDKIVKVKIDPVAGLQDFHIRKLALGLGLANDLFKSFQKIVQGLYKAFTDLDANQIEVNPMVITDDGKLLILDAKIGFDDNGLFKHPAIAALNDPTEQDPLETRAASAGISYVKMDGNIGCMVNGAGLAMATMDIIKLHGGEPANFLDVGGGADKERVKEAFTIILADKNVKGVLVNIFGGIMKCDIIAEGIIAAAKDIGIQVPLVVRLAGTNFELGKKILDNSELKIISANDLGDAAVKVVAAIV